MDSLVKVKKTNKSHGFNTPLRYPGGKGKLSSWLSELIEYNQLIGCHYIEPYAGGAGAALNLLKKGFVSQITINDIDPMIFSFWTCVLNDTDRFINRIECTEINMNTWFEQKEILKYPDNYDQLQTAFATFFLNRTNRSGIIKGGVIGGKNQDGNYKLDARFNKIDLINRIRDIGDMRDKINVSNLDALKLLCNLKNTQDTNTLIYLDPPYFLKGSQLYINHYNKNDHKNISEVVKEINLPILITYDDCDEIESLYKFMNKCKFNLHYSTHSSRPKATELMFYKNLDLHNYPKIGSFLGNS